MAQEPSELPEWATDPPGGTITSPSTPTREDGFQPGPPRRQYVNWLFNLIYQWVAWFRQVVFRTSDIATDQALLVGTAPVAAAGLTVTAGSFSGRVYVDGYSMGPDPIDGPAHTYAANSDTYWDLGRDGQWTAAVVASGDPEPALTADSIRVYRVRTNGTDRTAVADYRRTRVKLLPFEVGVAGDEIDENNSRILTRYNGDGTSGSPADPHFTPISEARPLVSATGRSVVRLYQNVYGVLHVVFNAVWSGDDLEWSSDGGGTVTRYVIDDFTVRLESVSGGGPWVESDWATRELSIDSQIAMLQPILMQLPLSGRTKIMTFDSTDGTFGLYVSLDGTGSFGPCLELVRNARWNSSLTRWERVAAGIVTKLDIRPGAIRRLEHGSGLAANFNDTISPGSTWSYPLKYVTLSGTGFKGSSSAATSAGLQWDADLEPGTVGGSGQVSTDVSASWNLELDLPMIPDGAIIAAVSIVYLNPVGNGELEAAIVRVPLPYDSAGVVESLCATNTFMDTLPQLNAVFQQTGLTVDASEAVRTVNREAWRYAIFARKTHTDVSISIKEVAIAYYEPRAVQ